MVIIASGCTVHCHLRDETLVHLLRHLKHFLLQSLVSYLRVLMDYSLHVSIRVLNERVLALCVVVHDVSNCRLKPVCEVHLRHLPSLRVVGCHSLIG